MGEGGGILGWHCRHNYWPFLDVIMERTHTDAELEAMKPENRPKTKFEGREYDDYQAIQQQRRIEREIRKEKRCQAAYKAAGLDEDAKNSRIRLQVLNRKYREFSKAAGLPEQRERARALYVDDASLKADEAAVTVKNRRIELFSAASPAVRLETTLHVNSELIQGIVPKGTEIGSLRIIAGGSSKTAVKAASALAQNYGGDPLQWIKMGGIIETDHFWYDIHWFELSGKHYEEKLKGVKLK